MYVGNSRFWLRAQGDGTVAAPGHLEHLVPWFGGSAEMVRVLLRAGARLRVSKAQPDSWRCPADLVVHLHLARRLALRRRHLRMADSCAKTFQTMRQNVIHRSRSFRTSDGHFAMFNVISKRDALNFFRFAQLWRQMWVSLALLNAWIRPGLPETKDRGTEPSTMATTALQVLWISLSSADA